MAGRRLDDHSFIFGKGDKMSPFPKGASRKAYPSIEGAGHVGTNYPDTAESTERLQNQAARTVKSHAQKEGFRQK